MRTATPWLKLKAGALPPLSSPFAQTHEPRPIAEKIGSMWAGQYLPDVK
jgi:hypothetical protein